MPAARCPVCEDIITVGVVLKLYQPVTCSTCLANLQVVSLSPFELDLPSAERRFSFPHSGPGTDVKKSSKNGGSKSSISDYLGGEDEDEEDIDDYLLERRQRRDTNRDRRRRGSG